MAGNVLLSLTVCEGKTRLLFETKLDITCVSIYFEAS